MRKLMWFSIGFLAACLICALFLVDGWLVGGCAVLAAAAAFLLVMGASVLLSVAIGAVFFVLSRKRIF